MAGARVHKAVVLAAAGAVVAAAATGTVLLFGTGAQVEEPESTPAPPTAPVPDDGLSPEPSDSTVENVGASSSVEASPGAEVSPGESNGSPGEQSEPEFVDPDPVKGAVEASESGSDLDFALEIVEPTELGFESEGGARQESPVESTGPDESDGTGGSGGAASAQGEVYTWQDGDRTVGARLQLDLVVLDDGSIVSSDEIVSDTGDRQDVPRDGGGRGQPTDGGSKSDTAGSGQPDTTGAPQPVFLSESGELMTLPGGIAVVLDPEWDADETAAFFAGNGIALSRVLALSYLTNGFFVETDPGFASLDLANALAPQVGVELSSPNWWRERTAK